MADKKWMEAYQAGTLSEAEELALLRHAREHHQKQKQQIAEIIRNHEMEEAKLFKTLSFRRNLYVIAAILVLLAIGWWIIGLRSATPSAPKADLIYAQITPKSVFEQLPAPELVGGALLGVNEPHQVDSVKSFQTAYVEKKYAVCIELGAQLPSSDASLQTLLAYCYLQVGDYGKSIGLLETLYVQEGIPKEKIRWWLGLAHGLAGNAPQMKKYLSQIQPKQYCYKEAQALLNK